MKHKYLKIINVQELIKIQEEYGMMLRNIEHLKNNPNTKKVDIDRIYNDAIQCRNLLQDL